MMSGNCTLICVQFTANNCKLLQVTNMKKLLLVLSIISLVSDGFCQKKRDSEASRWVDSVFKTLSDDQKIAQLMIVRMSSIDATTRKVTFYDHEVEDAIRKYNVGGI